MKKKIGDKRVLDLLFKMYKSSLLCPTGFYLHKKNKKIQANSLSSILCNIFLSKLDVFVKDVVFRLNIKNCNKFTYNHTPFHLRSFSSSPSFKLLKKNSNSIKKNNVKYVRYFENCLLGIKGSFNFVFHLKTRLGYFIQTTFH